MVFGGPLGLMCWFVYFQVGTVSATCGTLGSYTGVEKTGVIRCGFGFPRGLINQYYFLNKALLNHYWFVFVFVLLVFVAGGGGGVFFQLSSKNNLGRDSLEGFVTTNIWESPMVSEGDLIIPYWEPREIGMLSYKQFLAIFFATYLRRLGKVTPKGSE